MNKSVKSEPLVSVVITAFNAEEYIEKSVYSVLCQTYKNLEVIIVDDASTDNTLEIIRKIKDSRIRVFGNSYNNGTYFCKNFGITKAVGEFIAIQDADDISDPYRISKSMAEFYFYPELKIVKTAYLRYSERTGKVWFRSYIDGLQTSVVRKEVFETLGYFDHVFVSADAEFDERVKARYGRKSVKRIQEFLYFALQSNGGLTTLEPLKSKSRIMYCEDFRLWHQSSRDLHIAFPMIERPFEIRSKSIIAKYINPKHCFEAHASLEKPEVNLNVEDWRVIIQNQLATFKEQIMLFYCIRAAKEQAEFD